MPKGLFKKQNPKQILRHPFQSVSFNAYAGIKEPNTDKFLRKEYKLGQIFDLNLKRYAFWLKKKIVLMKYVLITNMRYE